MVGSKRVLKDARRLQLEKKLLKKVKKGRLGSANAEAEIKAQNFRFTNSFDEKLLKAQKDFLLSRPKFVKGFAEHELEIQKRKDFEKNFYKMQKTGYNTALKFFKKGEFTPQQLIAYFDKLAENEFKLKGQVGKKKGLLWEDISDYDRFKLHSKSFKTVFGFLKNKKITKEESINLAKGLGFRDTHKWWERYFQHHPDAVPASRSKVKFVNLEK